MCFVWRGVVMVENSGLNGQQLDLSPVLAGMSKILLGGDSLGVVLGRIAELCRDSIPTVDEVSVTFVKNDKAQTVAFTGQLAASLDERQYQQGFGPCLDAAVSGQTVVVDTAADTTYAEFSRAARRAGVTHGVSVGLPIPHQVIGALNIYSSAIQSPDREVLVHAQALVDYVAVAVANAALYDQTAQQVDHLGRAMASRAVIEQAKGILMARRRVSAEEAFTMLVRASQHGNLKLRDVAQNIVDKTVNEEPH